MLYFSFPEFLLPTAIPTILSEVQLGQATFLSYDLKKVLFLFVSIPDTSQTLSMPFLIPLLPSRCFDRVCFLCQLKY